MRTSTITAILGLASIAGSAVSWQAYLDAQLKLRVIDHIEFMAEREVIRTEVIADICKQEMAALPIEGKAL